MADVAVSDSRAAGTKYHVLEPAVHMWLAAISATPARPAEAWIQRYANGAGSFDSAQKVVVDNAGNVIVTGFSGGGNGASDYATIKYSATTLPLIRHNSQIVGNSIVLSWINAAFSLQAAPDVRGDYTNVPGATSPYATSLSGGQRYFRLKGN